MTTLQEMDEQSLTPDSLILIMLKRAGKWDQVAVFVTLTMCREMEIAWEWQRQLIAPAAQDPMPDLAISPMFAISNPVYLTHI